ncbi:MAG: addiction module protein [bacterium]
MKLAVKEDISALSSAEKLLLVEDLWDEISLQEENIQLTKAQKEELDKRYKEYRANPRKGKSWAEVKKNILKLA